MEKIANKEVCSSSIVKCVTILCMRCKLSQDSRDILFRELDGLGYSTIQLANILVIHQRTLRDWKRGKFTFPKDSLDTLIKLAAVDSKQLEIDILPTWWHNKDAGKAGGRKYVAKYGVPGTQQSRKSGGVASYNKRRWAEDDIYARNQIVTPIDSYNLAEFVGLMIGDGSVGLYQISITLNNKTDVEYANYVITLINSLFGIIPQHRQRLDRNCIVIEVSSINLITILANKGLPVGNKLLNGLCIPEWIKKNKSYSKACLRGIFDTDGSIFQETHRIKAKEYSYCRMSFVSASSLLLDDIHSILNCLDIRSKIRGNRAVSIERFTEIQKYFRIVGSSNPKHNRRYIEFGGVG